MDNGYLGLPKIKREDFNRLWELYYPGDGLKWVSDGDGVIEPDEVEIVKGKGNLGDYVDGLIGTHFFRDFTEQFNVRYRQVLELRRQELVRDEVGKTVVETIVTDLESENLPPDEREMIKHILKAGAIMDDAFQMQLGSFDYRGQMLQSGTAADREMMARYQRTFCEANQDPLCSGLATFTPRMNLMSPEGLSQDDATKLGSEFVNPFTVVVEEGKGSCEAAVNARANLSDLEKLRSVPFYINEKGICRAMPYALSFLGPKQREAANELRLAAGFADKINEKPLGDYMRAVARAFESDKQFPYAEADAAWRAMKGNSRYYLRIGADEVQWDEWQKKAGFHMIFGRIDGEASQSVEMYTNIRQDMEKAFAEAIGSPYTERAVDISLPDFVNVIVANGDSRGSVSGTSAAQTLPNWCGEDGSAECQTTRIMQFLNKIARGYSPEVLEKFGQLIEPGDLKNMDLDELSGGFIDHEFAHNLGPRQNLPAGNGMTLEQLIGGYSLKLEELKAQTGSLFLKGWMAEKGMCSEAQLKARYTATVLWMFGHIRRGLSAYREGKYSELGSPYIQLASVMLGYLQEKGAIVFNEDTRKFKIKYEKMSSAVKDLLRDVGQIYMRHNPDEVRAFFEKYTKGDGLALLHMDDIDRTIGSLPTTLFDWEVKI